MDHQDWETVIIKKKKVLTGNEKRELELKKNKYNKFLKENEELPKVVKTDLDIRKFFEKARLKKGLSQVKLASLLNVPSSTITQWENGKIPIPKKMYQKINNILSINLSKKLFNN